MDKMARIERKIIVANLASVPPYATLALGMYAYFGAQGEAFIPILNEPDVAVGLLATGGFASFIAAGFIFRLVNERQALRRR